VRILKLIGLGAGHPDHITVQAIKALATVDVVFMTDKGAETAELQQTRRNVCAEYMKRKPYRIVEIADPPRERRPPDYRATVDAWHEQRTEAYEAALGRHLADGECGAFLIWGDPSLYDSAMRIVDRVLARGVVHFEYEIIPGISSVQALCARHRIPLNEIGAAVHVTTGRRLGEEPLPDGANVLVMLDGECTFRKLPAAQFDIYWGAYLGMPDETLICGPLAQVGPRIEATRAEARRNKGWIMDTYLLRRRT
jgi:precorrin-6A synthase